MGSIHRIDWPKQWRVRYRDPDGKGAFRFVQQEYAVEIRYDLDATRNTGIVKPLIPERLNIPIST
jgi:hypothetical protein